MTRLQTRKVETDRDLQHFFDEVALNYVDQHGNPEKLLAYRLSIIRSLVGEQGAGSLLEIGCGTGIHLFALTDCFDLLMGTDISPLMIEQASKTRERSAASERVRLEVDRAEELSTVPDETVDCVLCVGAFEHMLDRLVVVQQVQRVLRPGGTFVCLTPNGDYLWYRFIAPTLGFETRHLSTDRFMSLPSIRKLLAETSLVLCREGCWTFVPRGDIPGLISALLTLVDLVGRVLNLSPCRGGVYFRAIKPGR